MREFLVVVVVVAIVLEAKANVVIFLKLLMNRALKNCGRILDGDNDNDNDNEKLLILVPLPSPLCTTNLRSLVF